MSRNIGSVSCSICGAPIVLDEQARPIRPIECGALASEYIDRLVVANAHCSYCGTLYLAWVRKEGSFGHLANNRGESFVDLSFRHSFNDEPHTKDLPPQGKLTEIADRHRRQELQELQDEATDLAVKISRLESKIGSPSWWETYRRG